MARLAFFLFVVAAATSVTPVDGQEVADKRPTKKIWNLTGPLGEAPKRVTDAYPLSDQNNKGGWIKFDPMSDEFDGQELDLGHCGHRLALLSYGMCKSLNRWAGRRSPRHRRRR